MGQHNPVLLEVAGNQPIVGITAHKDFGEPHLCDLTTNNQYNYYILLPVCSSMYIDIPKLPTNP